METTRHFTATTYVVNDGATLLHEHRRLKLWLPPGGHVDRDELPRETARREVCEETGLDVTLLEPETSVEPENGRELPPAEHVMLFDINVHESGEVGHQHIDFIFFGEATDGTLDPSNGEVAASEWKWFTPDELESHPELTTEVVDIGTEAIRAVESR